MKKINLLFTVLLLLTGAACTQNNDRVVILHTNDTHSTIDPNDKGLGGILRRKVIVDSIRKAESNVLLVDAGDAVQGTPYYSMFGGDVEFAMIDRLKYDYVIMGNHELDNGVDSIAYYYKKLKAQPLSTNYDLSETKLAGVHDTYGIKEFGEHKIGFLGINVDPKGLISDDKCIGIKYFNPVHIADSVAEYLKTQMGVDAVVAISHIGYKEWNGGISDITLAKNTKNIDLIIGGHSHTTINPAEKEPKQYVFQNLDGRNVVVTQTGSHGKNLGCTTLEFVKDSLVIDYKLIPVTDRYDDRIDAKEVEFLAPYKQKVDSMMNHVVCQSDIEMRGRGGCAGMNWISDMAMELVPDIYKGKVDFAIMNKGGMRVSMPKGDVSEGVVKAMFPFDNHLWVLKIKGAELLKAFKVMAGRGGDSVSKGVEVVYDKNGKIKKATLNGQKIRFNKEYTIVTLDYLANGGDYMDPLKNGKVIAQDDKKFGDALLEHLKIMGEKGIRVNSTDEARMSMSNK